ncbi:ATP dependent DNA ligase [Paenibacillus medicaginis]|uniref:DNA ligase (ATP) n=1 Tax=Paenibacillus medicaginis TaxID=1470560 RepID=A0ABV5BUL4_9BACL
MIYVEGWDGNEAISLSVNDAEVYITGYRKDEFGWLIGYKDGKRIRPAGILELGVGSIERKSAWPILSKMKTKENKEFVFVEPALRCKVKFREWTKVGLMRLPVFDEFVL